MAAMMLSEPGKRGPCVTACQHRECAKKRAIAGSICRLCTEQIGYMRWFCRDRKASTTDPQRYIHERCMLKVLGIAWQNKRGEQ